MSDQLSRTSESVESNEYAVFVKMGKCWTLHCLTRDIQAAARAYGRQVLHYNREAQIVHYDIVEARVAGDEVLYGDFEVSEVGSL